MSTWVGVKFTRYRYAPGTDDITCPGRRNLSWVYLGNKFPEATTLDHVERVGTEKLGEV